MKLRLKELRIENGLKQKDVAEHLCVTQQAVAYYENSVSKPDPETLVKLADYFHVSVDYLLGREDDFGNVILNADLTEDERNVLSVYKKLPEQRKKFFEYVIQQLGNSDF